MNAGSCDNSRVSIFRRVSFVACLCMAVVAIAICDTATGDAKKEAGPAISHAESYVLAPKAFRAAMKRVLPAVVTIETYGGLAAPIPTTGSKRAKLLGRFRGISRPGEGPTTGLIISKDGYIVTSTYNFLRNPQIITVVLADGSQHVAKLLGRDNTRKICLLKIDVPDRELPVPEYAPTEKLRVGQWSISVGLGYDGRDSAMSAGIISANNRVSGKAVQTDANISPANYGGPLIDLDGRVIGVCVPLNPRGGATEAGVEWYDSGIGFAVTIQNAERVIERMKKGHAIEPGRIGVTLKPVAQGKDVGPGAQVVKVLPKAPGEKAGLKTNDVIIAVEDKKVLDVTHLRALMGRYTAGDTIKLKLRRGDMEIEAQVTLVSPAKLPKAPANRGLQPKRIIPEPEKSKQSDGGAKDGDKGGAKDGAKATPEPEGKRPAKGSEESKAPSKQNKPGKLDGQIRTDDGSSI